MDKETALHISEILHQVLPYLQRFKNKILVVKMGGNVLVDRRLMQDFAADISLMRFVGMLPVVVHGGGPAISTALEESGIPSQFKNGLRVTDQRVMAVVEPVLAKVNAEIAAAINAAGEAQAAAFADSTQSPVIAQPASGDPEDHLGVIDSIDGEVIKEQLLAGRIPVISPVGRSPAADKAYNINADLAASGIACELKAIKLLLLTNVQGILKDGQLISTADIEMIRQLIDEGTVAGGMLPKVNCAVQTVKGGVPRAHIIDGRLPHATLLEIFTTPGVGTLISEKLDF